MKSLICNCSIQTSNREHMIGLVCRITKLTVKFTLHELSVPTYIELYSENRARMESKSINIYAAKKIILSAVIKLVLEG